MDSSMGGTKQVVENLSSFSGKVVSSLLRCIQQSLAKIANDAAMRHPYVDRTTHLTQAVVASPASAVVKITDKDISATIQVNRSYASYVEFGYERGRLHRDYSYLRPAMQRESPFFQTRVRAAIGTIRP